MLVNSFLKASPIFLGSDATHYARLKKSASVFLWLCRETTTGAHRDETVTVTAPIHRIRHGFRSRTRANLLQPSLLKYDISFLPLQTNTSAPSLDARTDVWGLLSEVQNFYLLIPE